jgi:hypothetical protein
MDRSLVSHLQRAFELAFFIHRDKASALDVTLDAMARVEVLAATQDKRRYYRPTGRSRVFMTKAQLLQKLLYISSEPYERRQEARHATLDEDDMTVRYVACLARICLRRNAFHVAVGFGRLLYAYPTGETLALYDLVAQDPERMRDSDYVRARKKRLVDELRRRFGPLLRPRRGQRGERRFEARETDGKLCRLVGRCLELMTPWETCCIVPEDFRTTAQQLKALSFDGAHPDDEHPVEMNRIHALLHPGCLSRLTQALGLTPPPQCLEVPRLNETRDSGGGDRGDRDRAPELGDADRRAVVAELDRREGLRRRAAAGIFRVHLDGVEARRWDAERNRGIGLTIDAETELVEVMAREGDEDVLLAAHLLPDLEDAATPKPWRASVRLRGGRRFDFTVSRTASELRCAIVFRASLLDRLANVLATGGRRRRGWRPAAAFALVAVAVLAAGFLLRGPDLSPLPPRIRGGVAPAAALTEIRQVFVDALGSDRFAEELRASLSQQLTASGVLTRVSERNQADAVLGLDASGELLILINSRREELWRAPIPAATDEVDELATRLVDELATAVTTD